MRGRKWVKMALGGMIWMSAIFSVLVAQAPPEASLKILDPLIYLGQPFQVSLEIQHPEDMVVIFPDSAQDFAPYEVSSITPSPTRTGNGISQDLVTYEILTWEISPKQGLQLPFRYILAGDTLEGMSNADSVRFEEKVKVYSDTLSFRRHGEPLPVEIPNPRRVILGAIALFLLLALLFVASVLLAKPARKLWRKWKLERKWKSVKAKMAACQQHKNDPKTFFRELNSIWREFLDDEGPVSWKAMSTPELEAYLKENKSLPESAGKVLVKAAGEADFVLYADGEVAESDASAIWEAVFAVMEKAHEERKGGVE